MRSEFSKLLGRIKRKSHASQREIAQILGVSDATISKCLHGRQRNTGERFVPELRRILQILDEKS